MLLFGPFQSATPNRTPYFCQGVVESVNIAWAVFVAFSFTSGCLCRDKKQEGLQVHCYCAQSKLHMHTQ